MIPRLAAGALDGAVIQNAYHEMLKGLAVLRRVYEAVKPGGRLVLCEPVPAAPRNRSRAAQMDDHVLDPALILHDLHDAGSRVLERHAGFATNLGGTRFGLVHNRRRNPSHTCTCPSWGSCSWPMRPV